MVLAAALLLILPDYLSLYGGDQLADARLVELKQDAFALNPSPLWLYLAAAAYWMACLGAFAGVWPQLAVILLLVLHHGLFTGHTLFAYGFDFLVCSTLFYLLPTSGNRLHTFHSPVLRTIQLHLCIVYFVGGFNKTFGGEWWDGEALWKATIQPGYPTVFPTLLLQNLPPIFWVIGGWAVIFVELCYPLFIWIQHTRRLWLWATVALHIGIALFMGLYFFSALMILLNLSAFHYPYLLSSKPYKPSILPFRNLLRRPTTGSETPATRRIETGNKP